MLAWARWCRRALVAAGVLALAMGGVSIFGQPDREILYRRERPVRACGSHGCAFIYRLGVGGDSGAAPQDEVIVRLRRDVVTAAAPP